MQNEVWILLSPLIGIVGLGLILLALAFYFMLTGDIRSGAHLGMIGMICVGMCGSIIAIIYDTEAQA